ncbi:MAG: type II CRISPR RNA-guided endonuclease Cas9 [Proteobacteria bacterium]|nr:MAG: type II CRISPR RNA-guided endonuclease Cas9 [Pseudomonadota bacterium]
MGVEMDQHKRFGIDLGIGSCGWAVASNPGEILGAGSWVFDVPETDKERTPTNQIRRGNRLLRRVTRRRRQRMTQLRQLFHEQGLLAHSRPDALKRAGLDPWELRARGLDKMLEPAEWAVVLGHIAKHRGFKSNSKSDLAGNAPPEGKAVLSALTENAERLAKYRTVGEMFARDPHYAARRRNREGDYSCSVKRDDQEHEVRKLFERQRALGNSRATDQFEEAYRKITFFQRPLQDSADRVGYCPFERQERRAAKHSYSFELFRLISKLNTLTLRDGKEERRLTSDEIKAAISDFGAQKSLTYKSLRKKLKLSDNVRFNRVSQDEEAYDVAARKGSCAAGTYALRKVVGEAGWAHLIATPHILDQIAWIITFYETIAKISSELKKLSLQPLIFDALMKGLEEGAFKTFTGAAHISDKAARNIIPHLLEGLVYSDACAKAGYNHAEQTEFAIEKLADLVNNPIARKAIHEGWKQIRALVNRYGLPGAIHIEMARDMGKSLEERREIETGIKKRTKQRDDLAAELAEHIGRPPRGEELLRYELWKEQNGKCLYTDANISPSQLVATDNSVQIDHILPWSRFGDDSFANKTLCTARANQEKRGRTPYEWFRDEKSDAEWMAFETRLERCLAMKNRKKNFYRLRNAEEAAEKFRNRNLNDTRYAMRVLMGLAKTLYPKDEGWRVRGRPGALTAALRKSWGIESLKKVNGERIPDDRHHALDAMVVAAISDSEIIKLTEQYKEAERRGEARQLGHVPEPWEGFREEVKAVYERTFVARGERRRARGEGHAATIRQVVNGENGEAKIYERRAIADLTAADLARIKDPERNAALIDSLRAWIDAGKPADKLPTSPKGDVIRKVRLLTNKKLDVPVRGGAADRGEMVRVDIFAKPNKRGKDEFYVVPIYRHEVADRANNPTPPNIAIPSGKPIDSSYRFCFSVYSFSYLEVVKSTGEIVEGYFRSFDRNTGAITLSLQNRPDQLIRSIGIKTLSTIKKFTVDRFGNRYEVKQETRTWHGAACTSPNPPD